MENIKKIKILFPNICFTPALKENRSPELKWSMVCSQSHLRHSLDILQNLGIDEKRFFYVMAPTLYYLTYPIK